jgi:hypothetical protein
MTPPEVVQMVGIIATVGGVGQMAVLPWFDRRTDGAVAVAIVGLLVVVVGAVLR